MYECTLYFVKLLRMGKFHSKERPYNVENLNNNSSIKTLNNDVPEPEVSQRETKLIKDTWSVIQQNISEVGVITFLNLFETHPEVQNAFMSLRTKNNSDLKHNHILRAHALRVMGTVEKCIYRLDNREKLRELMMELGTRHSNYSVKVEYIDLMGPQFISSIKPNLEDTWTEDHQRAWENLFKLMCYYMKQHITR